jgi:hypothetical protein
MGLTFDEMVREMVHRGIPRIKAERAAGLKLGINGQPTPDRAPRVILALPLVIVAPWTTLVSENRRFAAHQSRIVMTVEYKNARTKLREIARALVGNAQPLECPLKLEARVWFPDKRVHDAPNFAGATHNALKDVIYTDDRWLHFASWEFAGIDPDRPRAEILISRH